MLGISQLGVTSNYFASRSELSRMDDGNVEGYIISQGPSQDSNCRIVVPTCYLAHGAVGKSSDRAGTPLPDPLMIV